MLSDKLQKSVLAALLDKPNESELYLFFAVSR